MAPILRPSAFAIAEGGITGLEIAAARVGAGWV